MSDGKRFLEDPAKQDKRERLERVLGYDLYVKFTFLLDPDNFTETGKDGFLEAFEFLRRDVLVDVGNAITPVDVKGHREMALTLLGEICLHKGQYPFSLDTDFLNNRIPSFLAEIPEKIVERGESDEVSEDDFYALKKRMGIKIEEAEKHYAEGAQTLLDEALDKEPETAVLILSSFSVLPEDDYGTIWYGIDLIFKELFLRRFLKADHPDIHEKWCYMRAALADELFNRKYLTERQLRAISPLSKVFRRGAN